MDLVAGAVGSVVRKLGDLLHAEYKLHKGLSQQIECLKQELESANTALLMVGEVPPEELNPDVRLWAREIREASYDMEDIIDTFLVEVVDVSTAAEKKNGLWKRLQEKIENLFRKTRVRHTIGDAIEQMAKRLEAVADRRSRYSVPVALPAPARALDPRLMDLHKEAAQLIGIGKKMAELIDMLQAPAKGNGGSDKMKIVSVVGAGGLGKTTLAKAVYDQLTPEYGLGAFVSVGRNPDLRQVFNSIFFHLDRTEYEATRRLNSLQLLIGELRKFLQNKRYFVVIDDVWDITSWEAIKTAFDCKNVASKVITTTRNRYVASEEVYELEPLSRDDSKKLFCTRLFGGEGKCLPNHLDEISEKILDKCGGVPLAIITMASLLLGKTREDWYEVCNSPGFCHGKNNKQVDDTTWILSLSYYDLPSHLKTCLLYLSVYPEDYLIDKGPLIWKWIAEGFIEKKSAASLFQLGEEYFHQLINRSMIQAVESKENGIYGCRVHDMVLDLIRRLSNEENFVTISNGDDEHKSSRNKVRRIAYQTKAMEPTDEDDNNHMDMAQTRSLVACGWHIDRWVLHPSFKLLRVLAIEGCKMRMCCLGHLGKLLHLRYLAIRDSTSTVELPQEIGALKHLQTLDLEGTRIRGRRLPSSACLLTRLVCLSGCFTTGTRVPDGFLAKVTSLEVLDLVVSGVNYESKQRLLEELGNLSQLRALLVSLGNVLETSIQSDLLPSLSKLPKLQQLKYWDGIHVNDIATREWDEVVFSRHLRHLVIMGLQFSCVPSWLDPLHLPNISHLSLDVDHVDDAGLRALGALPELHYLSLGSNWRLKASSKATVVASSNTSSSYGSSGSGSFNKLRYCDLKDWAIQLVTNEDSTSVSFTIWNGKGEMAFTSKTKKDSSSCGVAPAPLVMMPNIRELEFKVPVRALYGRNGSCESLGLELLPSLHKIIVHVHCERASAADEERAVEELRHATQVHPNRPILEIHQWGSVQVVRSTEDQDNPSACSVC